jgi:hypothetical protein
MHRSLEFMTRIIAVSILCVQLFCLGFAGVSCVG